MITSYLLVVGIGVFFITCSLVVLWYAAYKPALAILELRQREMTKEIEAALSELKRLQAGIDESNKNAEERLLAELQTRHDRNRKEFIAEVEIFMAKRKENLVNEFETAKERFTKETTEVLVLVRSDAAKLTRDAENVYKTINAKMSAMPARSDTPATMTPETLDFHFADLTRLLDKGIDGLKLELVKRLGETKSDDDWKLVHYPIMVQLAKTLQHEWLQLLFARLWQSDGLANLGSLDFSTIKFEFDLDNTDRLRKTKTYAKYGSTKPGWRDFKEWLKDKELRGVFIELFDEYVGMPLSDWGKTKLGQVKSTADGRN
jgi:F0F1-type ATP synthase membrane subunit b/b'